MLKLQEFNYEAEYEKGKLNSNADVLSRVKMDNFEIKFIQEDLIKYPKPIAHWVSADRSISKGLPTQKDRNYQTKIT